MHDDNNIMPFIITV